MRGMRVLGTVLACLGAALQAHAAPAWEFAASPPNRMHLAAAPVSSGVAGVTEIASYSCIDGMSCTWSFAIALECRPGETALATVTAPALTVTTGKGSPGSFLRCGGPNPALPGTWVYLIERTDIMGQLALRNEAVTFRVGFPDANRMRDVRVDFRGSAAVIARVNSAHQRH